jgi:hypothetical protein
MRVQARSTQDYPDGCLSRRRHPGTSRQFPQRIPLSSLACAGRCDRHRPQFWPPSARPPLPGRADQRRHAVREQTSVRRKRPGPAFSQPESGFYQALADAFEHDQIEALTDETTIGQLAGLLTEYDSHGRMKIESKEDARKRGVPSPDRAEALMLALCKPPQKFEYYSVHDLPRLRSRSGEYPDDEDYRPLSRRTVGKTVDQNWRRTLREAAVRSIRGATIGALKRKFRLK